MLGEGGMGPGGVGGALGKRSVSPSGSSEFNYRAANAVKIDSPQCAAGC